jgi:8-oxo-dGTP pyrophosphatase MutT (NUDIX family)
VPTPPYVTQLRSVFGHGLLLLPSVSAVILDSEPGRQRILLGRRSDSGIWETPSGIVEPDEQPAASLVREVLEETGVQVRVERLVLLTAADDVVYANGDHCQFIGMTFACRYVAGEPHPADGECSEVGWFGVDELPTLSAKHRRRIACAMAPPGPAIFDT